MKWTIRRRSRTGRGGDSPGSNIFLAGIKGGSKKERSQKTKKKEGGKRMLHSKRSKVARR